MPSAAFRCFICHIPVYRDQPDDLRDLLRPRLIATVPPTPRGSPTRLSGTVVRTAGVRLDWAGHQVGAAAAAFSAACANQGDYQLAFMIAGMTGIIAAAISMLIDPQRPSEEVPSHNRHDPRHENGAVRRRFHVIIASSTAGRYASAPPAVIVLVRVVPGPIRPVAGVAPPGHGSWRNEFARAISIRRRIEVQDDPGAAAQYRSRWWRR